MCKTVSVSTVEATIGVKKTGAQEILPIQAIILIYSNVTG
jgi:hypothetical protein